MDKLIPWPALESKLSVRYPKRVNCRPPYALGVMLRVHCMQLFYNLSDPMMEDALMMAVWRRKSKNKVLIHSDQGIQYSPHQM